MARRVLKPLTPLLVALVAVVLGVLAIGPSFADDVPPGTGPTPALTPAVSTTPQVLPTGLPKPKVPKIANPSEASCASCMAPIGD